MATTRTIELKTEIPGPRSRAIVERHRTASVASPLALTFPVVAESARGVTLTDVDGNTFIDFAGGVGTLNVGHSHPDVVAAAQEQLERFSHTDFTIVPYEVYVTLAERLAERVPISGPVKAGVLQRRHRGGRERGQVRARLHEAPGGHRLRGRLPRPHADVALAHLEDAPVQGRARPVRARGLPRAVPVRLPRHHDRGRARGARARVHGAGRGRERRGDRVRARAGRGRLRRRAARVRRRGCGASATSTGSCSWPTRCRPASAAPAASSRWSTSASSPTWSPSRSRSRRACRSRACSAAPRSWTRPVPGGVGGTYVGNPVAQAAALAVLDVIDDEGLVERSATIGETIRARMLAWQERWPAIGDVRGLGSMLAIELVSDPATKKPAPELDERGRRRRRSSAACCSSPAASTATASACSSRSSSPTRSSTRRSASGKRRSRRLSISEARAGEGEVVAGR